MYDGFLWSLFYLLFMSVRDSIDLEVSHVCWTVARTEMEPKTFSPSRVRMFERLTRCFTPRQHVRCRWYTLKTPRRGRWPISWLTEGFGGPVLLRPSNGDWLKVSYGLGHSKCVFLKFSSFPAIWSPLGSKILFEIESLPTRR